MHKNAAVDAVHDGISPQPPVPSGPHFVLIGCRSLEARATTGQCDQNKIGSFRLKIVVLQMPHVNVLVWRSLFHQERFIGHGKGKMLSGLPGQNRLLEAARREAAFAVGGQAFPLQTCFDGISNPKTKWPLFWFSEGRESD